MIALPRRWEPTAAPGGHGQLLLAFELGVMVAILPPGTGAWASQPARERGGWRVAVWREGGDGEPLLGVDMPDAVVTVRLADLVAAVDEVHHDFFRSCMQGQLVQARVFEHASASRAAARYAQASGQVDLFVVQALRAAFPNEWWYEPSVPAYEPVPNTAAELIERFAPAVPLERAAPWPQWIRTIYSGLRAAGSRVLPSQCHDYARRKEDRLKTLARSRRAVAPTAAQPAHEEFELAQCELT